MYVCLYIYDIDQISQHFCTQDKARQSVGIRIQSYGISLRTFERSSRVHYLSTITIYILIPLPQSLPLFALFNRLEGTKFLKGLQCENVKTLHEFWHGQCCTCSPTPQKLTTVESCLWCKNVSDHWNAEKLQYKCNSYDSKKSLFLYILHFLVNKKNDNAHTYIKL